jgi:putative Ca2+/H+ antiporter (TMEM165/GDT1 family)
VRLAVLLGVFPLIFVAELPDKTMFASLTLGARGRPLAVWVGAAGAFAVHVAIAVSIGQAVVGWVPRRLLDGLVAAGFLLGAVLALRGARDPEEDQVAEARERRAHRVALTAFAVVFVAEWGDLTQILTANLAAHYHSPFSVGVGALLALWAVAGLAVVGGQSLLRIINIKTVRLVTAVVLVALAGLAAWEALK